MDDNSAEMAIRFRGSSESTNYAFSGKVMLATVVILAVVCIIIAFFHIYSRWFPLRRRAATHHISSSIPTVTTPQGLDPIVLKSLSNFTYFPTSNTTPFECIICLGEFEEFETCRLLPKCNHCFHLDCIDLWFQSHANCPLCRSPVQSESESPIGETTDVLTVIVEVPVTDMGRDRVSEGEDNVSESERCNVFKRMEEPVRLLRRFLSI